MTIAISGIVACAVLAAFNPHSPYAVFTAGLGAGIYLTMLVDKL